MQEGVEGIEGTLKGSTIKKKDKESLKQTRHNRDHLRGERDQSRLQHLIQNKRPSTITNQDFRGGEYFAFK